MKQQILVWDLPVRIFHWTLALSFTGAFLTAESERWRDIHVLLGYVVLGLIAFRLVWGVIGTRYARFTEFVRGPAAVASYLRRLIGRSAEHPIGHNPAGAVAIVLLLILGIASGASGWALYQELGGDWLEEVHEFFANAMLAVVFIHVAGVLVSSRLHGENLVLAMITGRKRGEPHQAIAGARPLAALLLIAGLAGFWAWWDANSEAPSLFTATQAERSLDDDD